jgi:DNA-binding transcriptional LysR family regulator
VTAPVIFGRMYVAPIVLDFLARHPRVTARMLFLDRVVDLIDEGLDVAVRIAHLPDSSLRAVQVGSVRWVVCGSPKYLAARGTPRTPADLSQRDAIAFSLSPRQSNGRSRQARRSARRPSSSSTATTSRSRGPSPVEASRVLSYQIAPELRAGKLQIVLSGSDRHRSPISVVYAEGRRAAAKVRAFVDFAVERLRSDKSLN